MQFLVQTGFKVQYLFFSCGFRTKLKVIGLRGFGFRTPSSAHTHADASARMPRGLRWDQVETSTLLSGAVRGLQGAVRDPSLHPRRLLMLAARPWPLMVRPVAWQPVTPQWCPCTSTTQWGEILECGVKCPRGITPLPHPHTRRQKLLCQLYLVSFSLLLLPPF